MEPASYPESVLQRRQELTLDQALSAVGEFGAGQRLQLCVAGLGWALASFHTLLAVFAAVDPLAGVKAAVVCAKGHEESKACAAELAKAHPDVCSLPPGSWEWTHKGASLASEFNLVCGMEWVLQLINLAFFAGVLLGCIAFQLASERFGRRRLLYTGAALSGITGIMCCTSPSLWIYVLFRGLTGCSTGFMAVAAFVLGTDPIGPSWRGFGGLLLHAFFSGGACLATLAAMVVPGWRLLSLLGALASLAYIPTWPYLQESPAWLLLRGRKGEATAALAAFAFANRTRPPEHPLADPTAFLSNPQSRFRDLMAHSKLSHRLLLSGFCWFAAGLVYPGVLLLLEGLSGRETKGEGSVYVTALTGFSYEVPGIAAAGLAAERLGRKYTLMAAFLQAGGTLVAAALTRADASRALAVGSRFGLAAAAATLFLQSSELFPSVVRSAGLAAGNYFGRSGGLLAPGLPLLAAYVRGGNLVPLLVAGGLCLAAGGVALLLPETLGNPPPETIQELNGASMKRLRSWTIALRQMFRSKSRQLVNRGEDDLVVLRTA